VEHQTGPVHETNYRVPVISNSATRRCSIQRSISAGLNRMNLPSLWNGTRRSWMRRRIDVSLTARYRASAAMSMSGTAGVGLTLAVLHSNASSDSMVSAVVRVAPFDAVRDVFGKEIIRTGTFRGASVVQWLERNASMNWPIV